MDMKLLHCTVLHVPTIHFHVLIVPTCGRMTSTSNICHSQSNSRYCSTFNAVLLQCSCRACTYCTLMENLKRTMRRMHRNSAAERKVATIVHRRLVLNQCIDALLLSKLALQYVTYWSRVEIAMRSSERNTYQCYMRLLTNAQCATRLVNRLSLNR